MQRGEKLSGQVFEVDYSKHLIHLERINNSYASSKVLHFNCAKRYFLISNGLRIPKKWNNLHRLKREQGHVIVMWENI